MSRKKKLTKTERDHRRALKEKQEEEDSVDHTTGQLLCSAEVAREVISECDTRLIDVDVALAFVNLAHEAWAHRPGSGQELGPLLLELQGELRRHADAIDALARRFCSVAEGGHEHLDPSQVDREHVRRLIFPPQDELRGAIGGQIPTDSEGH